MQRSALGNMVFKHGFARDKTTFDRPKCIDRSSCVREHTLEPPMGQGVPPHRDRGGVGGRGHAYEGLPYDSPPKTFEASTGASIRLPTPTNPP